MKTAIPITNSLLGEYIVDLNTTAAVERKLTGHGYVVDGRLTCIYVCCCLVQLISLGYGCGQDIFIFSSIFYFVIVCL